MTSGLDVNVNVNLVFIKLIKCVVCIVIII